MPRNLACAVATAALFATGCVAAAISDSGERKTSPAAISEGEYTSMIAGLRPPKRQRPIVAVLGANEGSETTDFLLPLAVLRESKAADVFAVGTSRGTLTLMPALKVRVDLSTADFDARHPDGADYVIVPALHRPDDPAVLAWIQEQSAKGATIVAICSGAKVISNAGLLKDRAGTGHWMDMESLKKQNPSMRWVPNRRYVVDRGVVTTTGVAASAPISLALVEAFAGRKRASEVAASLNVPDWAPTYRSGMFSLKLNLPTIIGNKLAFWKHETLGIPVADGVDDIALALKSDAYSRTYRSRAVTLSDTPVWTKHGVRLLPDLPAKANVTHTLTTSANDGGFAALDRALSDISARYGAKTANWVATQMEYPGFVSPKLAAG